MTPVLTSRTFCKRTYLCTEICFVFFVVSSIFFKVLSIDAMFKTVVRNVCKETVIIVFRINDVDSLIIYANGLFNDTLENFREFRQDSRKWVEIVLGSRFKLLSRFSARVGVRENSARFHLVLAHPDVLACQHRVVGDQA